MYRMCSLYLVAVDLPDYPTYELLHVLHLSLYILLEFVLVLTILSVNCLCIVLLYLVDHADVTFKAPTAVQLSPSLFTYVTHLLFPLIAISFGQLTEQY